MDECHYLFVFIFHGDYNSSSQYFSKHRNRAVNDALRKKPLSKMCLDKAASRDQQTIQPGDRPSGARSTPHLLFGV